MTTVDNKEQIRVIVSNIYDFQKMRISVGNRLVQSFYLSLGIEASTSPNKVDSRDKEEKSMIDNLKKEYTRISDGIANNSKTIKSVIKELNKSDKKLQYIRDDNDYRLIDSYMYLIMAEESLVKVLDKYVKAHPMWDRFFSKVKGCGTLMSGVCIAYLDPYKAQHVSSFFKYAGLDTVQDVDKDGNKIFLTVDNKEKVAQFFDDSGTPYYRYCDSGDPYEGDVIVSCHGRRKGDTEMQTYFVVNENNEKVMAIDEKTGEPLLKRGITYNPKLKTKLMGVLTGCMLKAKDPVYSEIYYDQRRRYDNSSFHKDKKDAQKHMMAQRYMIKEFLRALWICWRQYEGLTVDEPYEVAKLGNKPHKYNEAQCLAAKGLK